MYKGREDQIHDITSGVVDYYEQSPHNVQGCSSRSKLSGKNSNSSRSNIQAATRWRSAAAKLRMRAHGKGEGVHWWVNML